MGTKDDSCHREVTTTNPTNHSTTTRYNKAQVHDFAQGRSRSSLKFDSRGRKAPGLGQAQLPSERTASTKHHFTGPRGGWGQGLVGAPVWHITVYQWNNITSAVISDGVLQVVVATEIWGSFLIRRSGIMLTVASSLVTDRPSLQTHTLKYWFPQNILNEITTPIKYWYKYKSWLRRNPVKKVYSVHSCKHFWRGFQCYGSKTTLEQY